MTDTVEMTDTADEPEGTEDTEDTEDTEGTDVAGTEDVAGAGVEGAEGVAAAEEERKPRTDRKVSRRATLMAVLTAVVVLAGGVAVLSAVQSARLGNPSGNLALADDALTTEVRTQVGAGLKAILSYDYSNLARTERAAERVLVGEAVGQYERDFGAAREQARAEQLVRTTTVRSVGIESLSADEARLLVFLDQQTLRPEGQGGAQRSTTAAVEVTARKQGGEWKIAHLASL